MRNVQLGLLASAIAIAAFTSPAQARTGSTGGYYVTECKTVEKSPKVKRCTLAGCEDVYLPARKVQVCKKRWVNPTAR